MNEPPNAQLAEFWGKDASERLRFQQEFSLAGFKSLILINGAAVIGLLTYVGNAQGKISAAKFAWAFGGYIAGLVSVLLAYLTAYAGQALLMWLSSTLTFHWMGTETAKQSTINRLFWGSNICVGAGILLCCVSLGAFVAGSIWAMQALM